MEVAAGGVRTEQLELKAPAPARGRAERAGHRSWVRVTAKGAAPAMLAFVSRPQVERTISPPKPQRAPATGFAVAPPARVHFPSLR